MTNAKARTILENAFEYLKAQHQQQFFCDLWDGTLPTKTSDLEFAMELITEAYGMVSGWKAKPNRRASLVAHGFGL